MDNLNTFEESQDVLSGVRVKPAVEPLYITVLRVLDEFFHDLGKSVCEIIIDLINGVLLFTGRLIGHVWNKTENFRIFLLGKLKYAGIIVISPLLKLYSSYARMKRDFRLANREHGLKGAIPAFFKHCFIALFGKRGAAVTIFNYIAPIISVIFLVNLISYATDIEYAVRLEVNGKFIGYIENELVFTEAQKIFESRLNDLGSARLVDVVPQFTIEKVGHSEILSARSVTNILMEKSGIVVDYAFGIYIDNTFIGAVTDNSGILETLDSLLSAHRVGATDEVVTFARHVDVTQSDLFAVESFRNPQDIIRSLTQTRQEALFYNVSEGDTLYQISEVLNIELSELERLNPGITDTVIYPGQRIKYSTEVPTLPVTATRTEVYRQEIPYRIEYREDPEYFVGTSYTSINGEPGIDRITARVTYYNGVESQRTVISRETVSQPVTKIIMQGTRAVPSRNPVSTQTPAYGMFIRPIARHHGVSQWGHWNGGYRGHSGIDFGAPYGTPIFAAGTGKVIHAGWYGGYGNTVIIEHDNGLRTLYAHASALAVKVNQQVSQGETIAFVGSTGRSDGNHLHFEVRRGANTILNPKLYTDLD